MVIFDENCTFVLYNNFLEGFVNFKKNIKYMPQKLINDMPKYIFEIYSIWYLLQNNIQNSLQSIINIHKSHHI